MPFPHSLLFRMWKIAPFLHGPRGGLLKLHMPFSSIGRPRFGYAKMEKASIDLNRATPRPFLGSGIDCPCPKTMRSFVTKSATGVIVLPHSLVVCRLANECVQSKVPYSPQDTYSTHLYIANVSSVGDCASLGSFEREFEIGHS